MSVFHGGNQIICLDDKSYNVTSISTPRSSLKPAGWRRVSFPCIRSPPGCTCRSNLCLVIPHTSCHTCVELRAVTLMPFVLSLSFSFSLAQCLFSLSIQQTLSYKRVCSPEPSPYPSSLTLLLFIPPLMKCLHIFRTAFITSVLCERFPVCSPKLSTVPAVEYDPLSSFLTCEWLNLLDHFFSLNKISLQNSQTLRSNQDCFPGSEG